MNMNRLKEVRKSKKLTLNDVEEKTGIKNNTLSQYENGKREPKLETWRKLAKFYDVPAPYLQGIDVDEFIDKVDQEKLSTLGLFFYDDKSYSRDESLETTEIKLHESMVNSILYSEKDSALKNMNDYIEFLSKLKDEITAFDDYQFMNDYLINEIAEYWWDDTPNSDTEITNNKFISEILKRVENGDKKLRDYIVREYICSGSNMLDIYFEYKKKNKEDTTMLKTFLDKQHKEFNKYWNELFKK